MESAGSVESRVIVICTVLRFPLVSVATTVKVFAPLTSVTVRLQFATALPAAVPPVAAVPLTVMLVTPFPPMPWSVAVPLRVMLDVFTIWPGV